MLSVCQTTGSFVTTSFESSVTSPTLPSKTVPNVSNENTILLQNRPMIMEVREIAATAGGYDSKASYKCVSGSNEDTENDSGIENDCLSTASNNRVVVEEAKSIPLDDNQTMTIVQIENIDMINSQNVEVASTITVESTGQDKKIVTESNQKAPRSPESNLKEIQSLNETQNDSKVI